MDLILFRHGIAKDRQEWTGKDQDRPLTGKGRKKSRRSAKGLLNLGISPTHLFTSPLVRARETAAIFEKLARRRLISRVCDELIPGRSPQAIFSLLTTLPAGSVVLCVGHEPHLGAVAGSLLCGEICSGLSLKKAGACLIHLESPIQSSNGLLLWWLTAAQLRAAA
ncbi:MAG TPA: histidine phosphatase family protein [Nitrospira sp.]|jgi:phosphohistidine phosphatase|nr:histidine phosphatase family protein [Nitrospira sp.]